MKTSSSRPSTDQNQNLSKETQDFLQGFSKTQASMAHLPIPEQRQKIKELFLFPKELLEPVEAVEDLTIIGRHGEIPLRIITPLHAKTDLMIVFLHRGGWVYGSNDESENLCRKIANHTRYPVVQVEYRLSPEHKFPVPLEDCYDAAKWVSANLGKIKGAETKIIICGESAGGNLAAAVSLMAQNKKDLKIAAQVLIYPVLTNNLILERYEKSPDKHLLSYANMQWFWEQYLARPQEGSNPLASPLNADSLKGQPPTLIMAAEQDALCQEAQEFKEKLKIADVEVVYKQYAKVIHGFLDLPIESPEIQRALNDLKAFLAKIGE